MESNLNGNQTVEVPCEPGMGLDVGTSFLQVARQRTDGMVEFVAERDAFYAITPSTKQAGKFLEKQLAKQGAFVLKSGGTFYVVGKKAIETAVVRNSSVDRPLQRGVLTADNEESMGMLAILVEALAGRARVPDELCVYSYPANPVDADFDVVYHHNRISEILGGLGYKAIPLLESEALAYSELLENDDLTGVTISCGAGMHNLSVFHIGENLLSFSIAQGGDYIDKKVAQQMRIPETAAQAEKESEDLDLTNPKDRIHKLIRDYYINLIDYVFDTLEAKFKKVDSFPNFVESVPVVISGGTSLPKGYLALADEAIRRRSFPFDIKEVRHAGNPLTSVANGCLLYAQSYDEEE